MQIKQNGWSNKNPEDAAGVIKQFENMLKNKNGKIIKIVAKQGQILKQFKKSEELFKTVGLSRCAVYLPISLYKFMFKYPLLKISCLPSHYFKNNFEKIKKICKLNSSLFGQEKIE